MTTGSEQRMAAAAQFVDNYIRMPHSMGTLHDMSYLGIIGFSEKKPRNWRYSSVFMPYVLAGMAINGAFSVYQHDLLFSLDTPAFVHFER
ncbi:hypothetical protein BG003_008583 [Podila horticola]|nr:hypothetical protein BG003_008583 [Podila horticola]